MLGGHLWGWSLDNLEAQVSTAVLGRRRLEDSGPEAGRVLLCLAVELSGKGVGKMPDRREPQASAPVLGEAGSQAECDN